MALIKISEPMADAVRAAGQNKRWTEQLENNGITGKRIVVCSPQTFKALVTRGLAERVEGSVQEGRYKGVRNFFSVLTAAGELLRSYLLAGGTVRSFGEYQLTEGRLPRDKAGDAVRTATAVEQGPEEGVCGHHRDPITTCGRSVGHLGQHRDTTGAYGDSVVWGEPEPTTCGVHPRDSVRRAHGLPENAACMRVPGHAGLHRDTKQFGDRNLMWGDNESATEPERAPEPTFRKPENGCGHQITVRGDKVLLCARVPGHAGHHTTRPEVRRTGGMDVIETHESSTAALCSAQDQSGYSCTLDAGHPGQHEAETPGGHVVSRWSAPQPEPTADHVAHTVKIWYASGAYEEVGPLPQHHAATIYAECENNERVAAAEIHGHVHELIRSHLRG